MAASSFAETAAPPLFDPELLKIENFREYVTYRKLSGSLNYHLEVDRYVIWKFLSNKPFSLCSYNIRRILDNPSNFTRHLNQAIGVYEEKFDGEGLLFTLIDEFEKSMILGGPTNLKFTATLAAYGQGGLDQLCKYYDVPKSQGYTYESLKNHFKTINVNPESIAKYYKPTMIVSLLPKMPILENVHWTDDLLEALCQYNRLDIIEKMFEQMLITPEFPNWKIRDIGIQIIKHATFFHSFAILEYMKNSIDDFNEIVEDTVSLETIDMELALFLKEKGAEEYQIYLRAMNSANSEVYVNFKPATRKINVKNLSVPVADSGSVEILQMLQRDIGIPLQKFKVDLDYLIDFQCYEMLGYLMKNKVVSITKFFEELMDGSYYRPGLLKYILSLNIPANYKSILEKFKFFQMIPEKQERMRDILREYLARR